MLNTIWEDIVSIELLLKPCIIMNEKKLEKGFAEEVQEGYMQIVYHGRYAKVDNPRIIAGRFTKYNYYDR